MNKITKQKQKNTKIKYTVQSTIPLMLIVAVIPLISRMKMVPVSEASRIFTNGREIIPDFFSYNKMVVFLLFAVLATIIFIYKYFIINRLIIKKSKVYYPMIVFSVLVILSTVFATYKDVALQGFWDRYEGMYVLLGYMLTMFLSINLIDNEKQIKVILMTLGLSSMLVSAIGITQLLSKDIFGTTIGKRLMFPAQYKDMADGLNLTFGTKIYGTLYNPNYLGVYMSIIFILSLTILLLYKGKRIKVFASLISSFALINLLGSGSRAGMVSIASFIIIITIFFRGILLKRWKSVVFSLLSIILIIYSINIITNGYVMGRVSSLINSFEKSEDSNLKDIILESNKARILIGDHEIRMVNKDNIVTFMDENDKLINTLEKDYRISFVDEPYISHYIRLFTFNESEVLQANIVTNKGLARFNLIVNEDNEIKLLSPSGEMTDLTSSQSWGFKGREKFASNRGYIWSRSFPLLKDTVVLGHGPDTYALHFPHYDVLGKLQIGFSLDVLVDKPHNIYLQTAINTGVVSLLCLITIFIMYIISSVKLYFNKKEYNSLLEAVGIGIFFSVSCYLMMGFLNDSVVSISSVFWILLGIGFSINMKLSEHLEASAHKK